MFDQAHIAMFLWSLIYAALGVVIFGIAFWVVNKVTPFSVRKEIEVSPGKKQSLKVSF